MRRTNAAYSSFSTDGRACPDRPRAIPGRPDTVKTTLTSNRRTRLVENDQYAAFARRILRAYARRVADGDVEALALMLGLSAEIDDAISQAVTGLRAFGYSWADIALRLGITRQGAQQRWGDTLTTVTTPDGTRDNGSRP